MKMTPTPPAVTVPGAFDQEEVVRLLLQAMHDLGYEYYFTYRDFSHLVVRPRKPSRPNRAFFTRLKVFQISGPV